MVVMSMHAWYSHVCMHQVCMISKENYFAGPVQNPSNQAFMCSYLQHQDRICFVSQKWLIIGQKEISG